MKNDDINKIPATRVTLSASQPGGNPRNETVVKISAHRRDEEPSMHRSDYKAQKRAENKRFEEERFEEDSINEESFEEERFEKRRIERREKRSGGEGSFGPFIVELVFSALLLAALCAIRQVQIYANNTDLISFSDLGNSMWAYMCISVAVFALLRIFFRRPYFACMFTAFGTFLAVNLDWLVDFVRLFINAYSPAAIGALALYVVLLVGFFFFLRLLYKKDIRLHVIVKILAATFTCLVLFNVVMAFMAVGHAASNNDPEPTPPLVAEVTPVPSPKPSPTPELSGAAPAPTAEEFGTPNIYFFLLDEYSSFDMLQKYYGNDNKVFNDFLTTEGFNISRESYGTDHESNQCISDLFNLDYISKGLSNSSLIKKIKNGSLHKTLTDLGYSEFALSNSKYFDNLDTLNFNDEQTAYEKNDLFGDEGTSNIATDNSISGVLGGLIGNQNSETQVDTSALNQWGFYPADYVRSTPAYKEHKLSKYIDTMFKNFGYFEDPANYKTASPRIIYAYMTATHVPFVFDEYGGVLPFSQSRNWEDKNVYLNQYIFITKRMMESISSIKKNDPDSIIIIMSDHGIRYHADCDLKHTFYITDKDSCRIMDAVYIKGQKYDIEGLSGVNTLRFIMSLYGGQDYPPITDPITSSSPDSLKGIISKPR